MAFELNEIKILKRKVGASGFFFSEWQYINKFRELHKYGQRKSKLPVRVFEWI